MIEATQQGEVLKRSARRTVIDRGVTAGEVVKVFHTPGIRGLGDWLRLCAECRAAEALEVTPIRTPRVLGTELLEGHPALRFHRISGATQLEDALRAGRRRPLIEALLELVRDLELVGAVHPDPHPGNVLIDENERAWLVDVRGTRIGRPHDRWRRSIAQLCGALREEHPWFVQAVGLRLGRRRSNLDLAALEREARAARITANLRRVRVWLRESGATTVEGRGHARIVRVRPGALGAAGGGSPPWERRSVGGRRRALAAAWATLVRAHLHRLAAARPVSLGREGVVFDAPPGAVELEVAPSERLARALTWRGLAVRGALLVDRDGGTWIGPATKLIRRVEPVERAR